MGLSLEGMRELCGIRQDQKDILLPLNRFENFNNNNEVKGKQDLNIVKHEIKLIRDALESTQYNQIQAASLLGISRDALIRRMKKHDIRINKYF